MPLAIYSRYLNPSPHHIICVSRRPASSLTYRLPPFFFPPTTLKAALLSSFATGGPFFATSLHPPPLLVSFALLGLEKPAVVVESGMIPRSANLRRLTNSSAKRRPSSVWDEAYIESEIMSASGGSCRSSVTKLSTSPGY